MPGKRRLDYALWVLLWVLGCGALPEAQTPGGSVTRSDDAPEAPLVPEATPAEIARAKLYYRETYDVESLELLSRQLRVGMTKAEVEDLLGVSVRSSEGYSYGSDRTILGTRKDGGPDRVWGLSVTYSDEAAGMPRLTEFQLGVVGEYWWRDGWECGSSFVPRRGMIEAIDEEGDWTAAPALGLLVGTLPPLPRGVVLFGRQEPGWLGIVGDVGHQTIGVYVAPEQRSAVIFTRWIVEGSQGWTRVMRMTAMDGWLSTSCSDFASPADVRSPEYVLEIEAFNVDVRGRGSLIASGEISDPETQESLGTRWYEYRTKDGGATWSEPRRLKRRPAPPRGIYTEMPFQDSKGPEVQALVKDLLKSIE